MKKAWMVSAVFSDGGNLTQMVGTCCSTSPELACSSLVWQAGQDGKAEMPIVSVTAMEITGENLRTLLREIESDGGPKVVPLGLIERRDHDWHAGPPLGLPFCAACGMWGPDDSPCRGACVPGGGLR